MADLNTVALSGNLARDPEMRTTAGGKNVTSLRIGSKGYGDKTNWIDAVVWSSDRFDLAAVVASSFSKGDRVAFTGRLQTREYEKDGQKRSAFEVVVQDIVLPPKGSKPDTSGEPEF